MTAEFFSYSLKGKRQTFDTLVCVSPFICIEIVSTVPKQKLNSRKA